MQFEQTDPSIDDDTTLITLLLQASQTSTSQTLKSTIDTTLNSINLILSDCKDVLLRNKEEDEKGLRERVDEVCVYLQTTFGVNDEKVWDVKEFIVNQNKSSRQNFIAEDELFDTERILNDAQKQIVNEIDNNLELLKSKTNSTINNVITSFKKRSWNIRTSHNIVMRENLTLEKVINFDAANEIKRINNDFVADLLVKQEEARIKYDLHIKEMSLNGEAMKSEVCHLNVTIDTLKAEVFKFESLNLRLLDDNAKLVLEKQKIVKTGYEKHRHSRSHSLLLSKNSHHPQSHGGNLLVPPGNEKHRHSRSQSLSLSKSNPLITPVNNQSQVLKRKGVDVGCQAEYYQEERKQDVKEVEVEVEVAKRHGHRVSFYNEHQKPVVKNADSSGKVRSYSMDLDSSPSLRSNKLLRGNDNDNDEDEDEEQDMNQTYTPHYKPLDTKNEPFDATQSFSPQTSLTNISSLQDESDDNYDSNELGGFDSVTMSIGDIVLGGDTHDNSEEHIDHDHDQPTKRTSPPPSNQSYAQYAAAGADNAQQQGTPLSPVFERRQSLKTKHPLKNRREEGEDVDDEEGDGDGDGDGDEEYCDNGHTRQVFSPFSPSSSPLSQSSSTSPPINRSMYNRTFGNSPIPKGWGYLSLNSSSNVVSADGETSDGEVRVFAVNVDDASVNTNASRVESEKYKGVIKELSLAVKKLEEQSVYQARVNFEMRMGMNEKEMLLNALGERLKNVLGDKSRLLNRIEQMNAGMKNMTVSGCSYDENESEVCAMRSRPRSVSSGMIRQKSLSAVNTPANPNPSQVERVVQQGKIRPRPKTAGAVSGTRMTTVERIKNVGGVRSRKIRERIKREFIG